MSRSDAARPPQTLPDAPVTTSETHAPLPSPRLAAGDPELDVELRDVPELEGLGSWPALLAAVPADRSHLLWQSPGGTAFLGLGAALRWAPSGTPGCAPDFRDLGRALTELAAERLRDAVIPGHRELRALFTCAFDPGHAFGRERHGGREREPWRGYSPLEIFIPEILLHRDPARDPAARGRVQAVLVGDEARRAELRDELTRLLRRTTGGPRPSEPSPVDLPGDLVVEWAEGEHRANVIAALDALAPNAEPGLSKVVLAHAVEVRRTRPFDPAKLLERLGRAHPSCFLFSVRPAPGAPVFLGASPERLARVETRPGTDDGEPRRRVLSGALAGSAARGATPEEDRQLGRGLLESAKDREEHAIVGDMIASALAPLCTELEHGGEPVLEKLANVQHLYTPVTGRLADGVTLFDAVGALHPTPAVGGMPRAEALAAIRRLEARPRGLYAGVVGWADLDGNGDAAVAIRSALVDGARARVFAGGGIVPTSDPDVEVEETRLKLAAVLGAMKAAGE